MALDFGNARKDGAPVSYPNDLHGSGFTIFDNPDIGTDFRSNKELHAVSVILDATLDAGTGVLLTESPNSPRFGEDSSNHRHQTFAGYKVGIKGADSASAVNEAVFKGLKAATSDWVAPTNVSIFLTCPFPRMI